MLRPRPMVPRRLPRRAPPIRHRGFPMGDEGRRGGAREGNVRRGVFLRGGDRHTGQYQRVRVSRLSLCDDEYE